MAPPAVSVIVTAHNYGRFLDQCIKSVLGQTFQDFELIIVNDGSTDHTTEVLAGYVNDPRITILTLSGVGLAAACNHGIRRSRGMYVMRLDADDYLDPHALLVMIEVLTGRPEIGLVYPDYYKVDEEGRFLGYVRVPRVQEGARLLDHNPLAGGALYRRTCFDVLGDYNESLRYQEDLDFWLRFIERLRAYGVGLPLLSYRQHAGSMSRNRAGRAAARRFVKREYVDDRGLLCREDVLIVIPTRWPGAPDRSETWLWREFEDASALRSVAEHARTHVEKARVIVATNRPESRCVAESTGAEVVPPLECQPQPEERFELTWLRQFVREWSDSGRPVPTLVALVSPYCPLRHPERVREAIDTLVIHDRDLVVSIDNEPIVPWQIGEEGLAPILAPAEYGLTRAVREAGELMAVRTSWLRENQPMTDARTGYVELLYPEWWCIRDEASWQTCRTLLAQAAALRVQPSVYLRTEV